MLTQKPRRGRRPSARGPWPSPASTKRRSSACAGRSPRSSRVTPATERDRKRPTFNALAYGDHPYGSAQEGTLESVAALTREGYPFRPPRRADAGAGGRGRRGRHHARGAGRADDRILGDLPAEAPPRPEMARVRPDRRHHGRDLPPAPNRSPISAMPGSNGMIPTFFAAFVLNQGGSWRQRLPLAPEWREVRVERGLDLRDRQYSWSLADLSPAVLGHSRRRTRSWARQWKWCARNGPDLAEKRHHPRGTGRPAKRYMTGDYSLRFRQQRKQSLASLRRVQSDDMPADYNVNRNSYVEAVTLEDVRRRSPPGSCAPRRCISSSSASPRGYPPETDRAQGIGSLGRAC